LKIEEENPKKLYGVDYLNQVIERRKMRKRMRKSKKRRKKV